MDRLSDLRGEAGSSRDSTLDTTSPPSESFMSANESSSKYYSLSEVDSTFDISSIKDVSVAATTAGSDSTITESEEMITNLSPIGKKSDMLDSYKIGKQIEAANILSGGVDIFEDNDNSYDGDELVIDDNVELDDKSNSEKAESVQFKNDESLSESTLVDADMDIASKDTEVVLQIDGKNVDAIDIGNGLYLYRKEGQEELAAVQIIDDDQHQPSFKFLKVRENAEGNLEVYEEIEIEVSKEVPTKEEKLVDKNTSHVPIKDINKIMSDLTCNKVAERKNKNPQVETFTSTNEIEAEMKETTSESKTEVNLNGKMMKFSESRKSPVIGSFTPMTYHSTPNKEGKPLTKTMVDLQLHPNRHSDNVKKTIEVHTDSCKQRIVDAQIKNKDSDDNQTSESHLMDKEENHFEKVNISGVTETQDIKCKDTKKINDILEVEINEKPNETMTEAPVTKVKEKEVVETGNLSKLVNTAKEVETLHEVIKNDTKKENATVENVPKDLNKAKEYTSTNDQTIKETNEAAELKAEDNTAKIVVIDNTPTEHPPSETAKLPEGQDTDEVKSTSTKHTKSSQVSEVNPIDINKGICANVKDNISKMEQTETPMQNRTCTKPKLASNVQVDSIVTTENTSKSEAKSNEVKNKVEKHEDSLRENPPKQDINLTDSKTSEKEEKMVVSTSKVNINNKRKEIETKNVPKIEEAKSDNDTEITSKLLQADKKIIDDNVTNNKGEAQNKKEITNSTTNIEVKPINNNNAAVPFGKWTDVNRQEFLNKFKETKIPVNSSNSKQIKNSNDLNRRDVLKKIDSQRQSNTAIAKAQDCKKLNSKNEIGAFSSKTNTGTSVVKTYVNSEAVDLRSKPASNKKVHNNELPQNIQQTIIEKSNANTVTDETKVESKIENTERREVNTQDLIDKTIEGMISRLLVKGAQDETKDSNGSKKAQSAYERSHPSETSLDEIEMKMNELHGIPFIERPPHELPHVYNPEVKHYTKAEKVVPSSAIEVTKVPNLIPSSNKGQKIDLKENLKDVDSEEEMIEHEPITGDIELAAKNDKTKVGTEKKVLVSESSPVQEKIDVTKQEAIITENEFDKFARRNSISYENCITVNFDGKEPHNVIKTVKEKDIAPKTYSKNEVLSIDVKSKLPQKLPQNVRHNIHPSKGHNMAKFGPVAEDPANKNYQSKLQIAYQTALTEKRHLDRPITIIEDKPVKVVFMDPNTEFIPSQLNVQGQELSPIKKHTVEQDAVTISTCDSLDSDVLEHFDDGKSQDEVKTKTKHQRKQVLTPVEIPDIELIEPGDIGIEVSPKKKRKTEDKDNRVDKNYKNIMHKKSYLLGRSAVADDKSVNSQILLKDAVTRSDDVAGHKDAASAIDSLVKAAELLETQAENMSTSSTSNTGSQQSTPVKRGRGRPRKYPLPEGTPTDNKIPSPQKKPRLIDAKESKPDTVTDDDSSDGEIIRENWTMGKINENIVCPICNKLFRSENVVFKHVKHCTGPSPSRSDSDKRSPRRMRYSQESDTKSYESQPDAMEVDEEKKSNENKKHAPLKRQSKDSVCKSESDKADVIVIDDTPVKGKPENNEELKKHESRKISTVKIPNTASNLVCEFCGKTFRQLSYLNSHKLQHKREDTKKTEKDSQIANKSVFSCEVCKKDFRKLHHLVQHRIIHNPNTMPTRVLRKSSSEQSDKSGKEQNNCKQSDDPAAGFRCEPCDKSFRKLHHLVEHRETHDGINRQRRTSTTQINVEKPPPPPQCDICKKTFRKLHHLIEHKEQHVETSSEKSDDKSVRSVKSSLSTKDIIHECSLCYMVFPNEHSLNKHTVICQRKKRQSKQAKQAVESKTTEDSIDNLKSEENKIENINPKFVPDEIKDDNIKADAMPEDPEVVFTEKLENFPEKQEIMETVLQKDIIENPVKSEIEDKPVETPIAPVKIDTKESGDSISEIIDVPVEAPGKIKKTDKEIIKIQDTPKKKTPLKSKEAPTVTKRQKVTNAPLCVVEDVKLVESSDDDEVRYMLNPDFKVDDTSEGKLFMKVKATKRNSLQIERPSSRELDKRRISLQHPPKIPRLKAKPVETKPTTNAPMKIIAKAPKLEPVLSTDSDDSDVKYSFPKSVIEKPKPVRERTPKGVQKRTQRKSLAEKRKSLTVIAKRKSLGKAVAVRHKVKPSPIKLIKKRTTEVEHRCDCGQLFSSDTLLSRHVTLAHTPPRIRRRRSPPPDIDTKSIIKPAKRKSSVADKKQSVNLRKSSVKSDTSILNSKATISSKSSVTKSDVKTVSESRKPTKSADLEAETNNTSSAKTRRNTAHRGVPVPEKMKKLMQKTKK